MRFGRAVAALAMAALGVLSLGACAGGTDEAADAGPSSAPVPKGFARPEVFVDTAWLAANLGDSRVRVIDIRTSEKYQEGHIPGAVNVLTTQFTETVNDIPNMVSPPDRFAAAMGQAGVGADSHVIVVDDGNMLWASRLLWTLDYYGHAKSSVLHGGMAAWQADAREVTRRAPTVAEASFTPNPRPELVADVIGLKARLSDGTLAILDNRSPAEYAGEDVRAKQGGHIPGAINIDWNLHLNPGAVPALKTPAELRALYEGAGITRDKEVASYCQTAIRATHGYLVLKALGYDKLRVYDGSWVEWGNRTDTPIER